MKRLLPFLLSACGSVACGSTEQPVAAPLDAGVEVPVDVAPEVEPEPLGNGQVEIAQLKAGGTLNATATARFARNVPTTTPATCTRESFGPCDVVACAPLPPPESPAYEAAGDLVLTGGLLLAPLAIPRASQTYAHKATNEPYFRGADDLRVKASGGVVPAFELSVTTPEDLVVTKPACAANCGDVDRSRDYEIVWAPPRFGTVDVTLFTLKSGVGYATIACSVPAADGRLVVPAAALAKLRTDGDTSTLSILPRSSTSSTVEGWRLSFVTTANGPRAPITVK